MARESIYGKGFAYPFSIDSSGGVARAAEVESVKASLFRLLDTSPGEEFFLPGYGCGLKNLMFEEDNEVFRALVDTALREAVARWEPRIAEIIQLEVEPTSDAEPHTVNIKVFFRLIQDQNVQNLVYPFFSG